MKGENIEGLNVALDNKIDIVIGELRADGSRTHHHVLGLAKEEIKRLSREVAELRQLLVKK